MTNPDNDLRSLIDATTGAAQNPQPAKQPSKASSVAAPVADDDIHSVVSRGGVPNTRAPSQGAATSAGARRHRSNTTDADLNEAVQEAQMEDAGPMGQNPPHSVRTKPRLLAAALLLVCLLAAWAWHTLQPELSGPAATLRDLAQGVEQYRGQHSGSLPMQLSGLSQFPQTAVEWQLRYWKARDAAGRTEIMWAPNGTQHYRIVLRQGTAVWIYKDSDGLSRQIQK